MAARSLRACATWLPREALRTMARDAAKRFRELVAAGHEIPYDVQEPGNGSPLPRYVPLTERFVRDHAAAAARARLVRLGVRGDRVRRARRPIPRGARDRRAARRQRARRAGGDRLPLPPVDGLDRLLARGRPARARRSPSSRPAVETRRRRDRGRGPAARPADAVVRLELATATIVRADTVEVPAEARASEGAGAAGWEPTFLAAARVSAPGGETDAEEQSRDAGARSVEAFRQLITALRLFQAGGVGLGPYAWTRAGAGRWRRIATGAGRPRPRRLPPRRGRARRPGRPLARARLPLDAVRAVRRVTGPRRAGALGAGDLPLRGGPGAQRRARGAERLPAGAALRARGRRSGRPGPGDAGRGPLRRARAARRDQGHRRPRRSRSSASFGAASRLPRPRACRPRPRPRRRSRT